jgi:hypothetical protein
MAGQTVIREISDAKPAYCLGSTIKLACVVTAALHIGYFRVRFFKKKQAVDACCGF